jgi:hypothetical protein
MTGEARRARCPSCERMRRRPHEALCPDCWRAAPADAKRAHQALYRKFVAHRVTLRELLASINRVAKASRVAQFGEVLL